MRYRIVALTLLTMTIVWAAKKKNPDDVTQTLELPKDPPMVAAGETSRLVFQVSPLSNKGLLSQQTRDALKAILKANGGTRVVHIRAFVAGSGDLRRVPQIVSEVFTEKKMELPSVSVVQVGALPMEGAQVVLEAASEAKRQVNPEGLTFIEAESAEALLARVGSTAPLRVTCFVSDIATASRVATRFPAASLNVVQTQRAAAPAAPQCEAIVRDGSVRAAKLAFTGTQVAFGTDDRAARVAFERLDREMSAGDVVIGHIYALSPAIGEMARKIRSMAVLPVEGVASIDGSFAVDAIAASK